MTNGLSINAGLTWAEARQSPCSSCAPSYCCTHVLLHKFDVRAFVHVDLVQYLLNFEGIVIGLNEEYTASVFLNQACSHLDAAAGTCTVHGTDQQPAECRNYPAFGCEAQRTLAAGTEPELLLLDRDRFDWLRARLYFDEDRVLDSGPSWSAVVDAFETMPLQRHPAPPPPPDPAVVAWKEVVMGRAEPAAIKPLRWGDPSLTDPCSSCQAYCCQVVIVPYQPPASVGDLDHLRLLLGFPSVELAISEDRWQLFVHVRCRHLSDNRCTVYGQPERPLKCGAMAAVGCEVKLEFGRVSQSSTLRLDRDLYPVLESSIPFDEHGKVIAIPPLPFLRMAVHEAVATGR